MMSWTPLNLVSVILHLWFKSIEIRHFSLHPLGNKTLISALLLVTDLSLPAWKRPSVAAGAGWWHLQPQEARVGFSCNCSESCPPPPPGGELLSLDTGLVLLSRTCLLNTWGGLGVCMG